MPTTINRPQISPPQDTSNNGGTGIFFPIRIIDHTPQDSASDTTSTDQKDVATESKEVVEEPQNSKWFDIMAGILVSTVPMILGGYLLHILTREKEEDIAAQVAEPMPRRRFR